jgi:hypothetical protein
MQRTSSRRGLVRVTVILLVLAATTSVSAQNLALLQARSLDDVFDGVETVSEAAGEPVDREMLMMQASAMLGVDPGEFLDMDRPVAVVMPVQGMMLQQNGFVAAIPVSDTAAAIDALAGLFDSHTTEGDVHVFSKADQPLVYLIAADGYLRAGGNRDLVTGFDPLAGAKPANDLALEVFLEPVSPMIAAGLQAAKEQMKTEIQTDLESSMPEGEEVPYDPAAVGPMLDLYMDGVQSLLAATSSVRLAFDVDDKHIQMFKTLVAKPGSGLAGFFAAQKGGVPEIAKLADAKAAMYATGNLTLEDEQRQWLKEMVARYMDVTIEMFDTQVESEAVEPDADGQAADGAAAANLWKDYMTAMGAFSDRWVDCWRGDMVLSFDLPKGQPFTFTEVFGMHEDETCRTLIADMGARIGEVIEASDELASVMTVEEGPRVKGSTSLLITMDVMEMIESTGQPMDDEATELLETIYGEQMTAAMVSFDDYALVTGGAGATESLQGVTTKLALPGGAPSFAPLSDGASVSMLVNIGRFLEGLEGLIPEDELDLDGPLGEFRGEAGRIPMGLRFGDDRATFEMAMSLKTISTIAEIAAEERAEAAAAADAGPEPVPVEGD